MRYSCAAGYCTFSDKILLRSDWNITPENPRVHILEYQLPLEDYLKFQEKFGKDMIIQMKEKIYQKSLAVGLEPTCEIGEDVFTEYGFQCNADLRVSKVVDVYSIVKEAASKFNITMPKVALSNTMIANAAATGPSPNRGLVLITTGLLVQLEEDEILSVIGHEMGHLSGRDPLILFSIISLEFILRSHMYPYTFSFIYLIVDWLIFSLPSSLKQGGSFIGHENWSAQVLASTAQNSYNRLL